MLIVGAQNSFSQNLTGQILSEATSEAIANVNIMFGNENHLTTY